jgi:hypothetical protein
VSGLEPPRANSHRAVAGIGSSRRSCAKADDPGLYRSDFEIHARRHQPDVSGLQLKIPVRVQRRFRAGIADPGCNALTRGKKTVTKKVLTFLRVSEQKECSVPKCNLATEEIRIQPKTTPK